MTLVTVAVTGVTELMILRFVTGVALGAAIPSAVALTTEYSPKRLRATFVLVIYCGFSLGFVAAGGVAAWSIPLYGWRSMLWIGAVAPLLLAAVACITAAPGVAGFPGADQGRIRKPGLAGASPGR